MPIIWTPYTISARDGSRVAAEQGELTVPEDRSNPGSRGLVLRFVRIRAEVPSHAAPIIFLAGGPGDSGIQWASHPPFLQAFGRVSRHNDLILLDQRGCGTSERHLKIRMPSAVPKDALVSEAEYRAFLNAHLLHARQGHEANGALTTAYTVVESAKDIGDLAASLGYEKVHLWAYSYGTHLAQMVARLFNDRIGRIVLCGFEGPDQTYKLPSQIQEQLFRLHEQAGLLGYDLLGDMETIFAKAARTPFTVDVALEKDASSSTVRVGKFALQQMVASWAGLSNRFNRLPNLFQSLTYGGTAQLVQALPVYFKAWTRPLTFYLTDAASGVSPERAKRIAKEAPACDVGDAANFPFPKIGPVVGAGDIGAAMRTPLKSDLPFLILTGTLDGFTPTENAEEGMLTLPNARHILIESAAHNDLISSPEAVEQIARFLSEAAEPTLDVIQMPPAKFT